MEPMSGNDIALRTRQIAAFFVLLLAIVAAIKLIPCKKLSPVKIYHLERFAPKRIILPCD
jgi:hypothetical protein